MVIRIPEYERKWFRCPHCGKKLLLYTNNSIVKGVYVYCKRCKKDIEVKIDTLR